MRVCVTAALHLLSVTTELTSVCVCIPEKRPLRPEMAIKCQMKRFPVKVIKINDPYEAMLSCSLHRSCKSTASITDV